MRAVWYDRHGPAHDVLQLGTLPTPDAGPGEVRVRLEASGVNPADCYRRHGPGPMEYPRVVTHSDGAGVVDRTGPGAPPALLGRRVWIYNGQRNGRWMGTAAEYIALDADLVTPLPGHVSFAEGATLGIPCMTAHRCLFMAGPVQGRTVLVTGGAGAVGLYAVQLAAWAGATVIATVSSDAKEARAREAGAAHVVNYRKQDVAASVLEATGGAGADHVVDVDFGGNLAATLAAVKPGGSIAVYATNGDRTPRLPVRDFMQKNVSVHFMILPTSPHPARKRAQQDILAWTSGGRRILPVAARFPLVRTADAHAAVEAGTKAGTVVVEPQS